MQALLDRIVTSELKPGDSFGTEAELLEQYDVSRPTLREGLRILEAQGVLRLRPGPKGGILVSSPEADVLAHTLSVFLRLHGVPFLPVLRAREVIEPALAEAAAANASDVELAELQNSVDRMQNITAEAEFIEENRIFHSIIAKASRNQVLEVFWTAISILAVGEQHGIKYTAENRKHIVDAHQQIVDALRSRDGQHTAQLMEEHVRALELLVRKKYKHLLTKTTSFVDRSGQRLG
jgi:GntR family transcriptional regulator, transcriptional repressor for pyruvate dehydrogenase complex